MAHKNNCMVNETYVMANQIIVCQIYGDIKHEYNKYNKHNTIDKTWLNLFLQQNYD